MLKIIPLGGLGEIGLNMMVFEYANTMFIIDAGLMFPEDYMLGVDFVIPDMDYIRLHQNRILREVRHDCFTEFRQALDRYLTWLDESCRWLTLYLR